jgi:hypothetical protein
MLNLPGTTYDRLAHPVHAIPDAVRAAQIERRARLLRLGGGKKQEWTKGVPFGPEITYAQRLRARALRMKRQTLEAEKLLAGDTAAKENAVARYRLVYCSETSGRPTQVQGFAIMRAVAEQHHFTVADLRSESRYADLAFARMESMWLCAKLTGLSLPNIGRLHGGRDHTTVIHAVRRMNARFGANVRGMGTKVKGK